MTAMTFRETGDAQAVIRTARVTGLLYAGMCLAAIFGHFVIPGRLFDPGDAAATLANLAGQEALARLGVATELATATFQVLLALWFYRLFRPVDSFLAVATMTLGMFNAIAQFASAACLATALDVARDPSLDGAAATAQLMYVMSGKLWQVAEVFFGLWLIPMGRLVLRSGWMPRLLGWLLVAGGAGYVLHAFVPYLAPAAASIAGVLVLPSVSEFWMAGYLLLKGVRRPA